MTDPASRLFAWIPAFAGMTLVQVLIAVATKPKANGLGF
jgi:hypothetical protein